MMHYRNTMTPRVVTGGGLARTQEPTRTSRARADEDEPQRRQRPQDCRRISETCHQIAPAGKSWNVAACRMAGTWGTSPEVLPGPASRARIVLKCAKGRANKGVARGCGCLGDGRYVAPAVLRVALDGLSKLSSRFLNRPLFTSLAA